VIAGVPSERLNGVGTNLLSLGHTAAYVLRELASDDPNWDSRQVAVIDRNSGISIHCGSGVPPWSDMRSGHGYAVLCERARDATVVVAMAEAFERTADRSLDERLLCAMEAGASVPPGGKCLPIRSAGLVVWCRNAYSDMDLRVDWHRNPIDELRRVYEEFKPTAAYYEERARNPRGAMNAKEFAGLLQSRKAGAA
jgi:uncharacterized Ntn-hydrolase superfamily protein